MIEAFEINTKHSCWLGVQLLKVAMKPNSSFLGWLLRKGSRKPVLQICQFCPVETDAESSSALSSKVLLAQACYAMLSLKMQELSN